MTITVSNNIIVNKPTQQVVEWVKNTLILDNPDFYKLEKLGKWTGNTPKTIWLYERRGDDYYIPFGCLKDLWKIHPFKDDYKIDILPIVKREYKSNMILFDYQEKAVDEVIKTKNGILVMPCGSGKTNCGLEIIARIGGRALWLTHTQDLLNQSKERAESVLEFDDIKSALGTITAGKINIGTHITFATVQTMCKINLIQYKNSFDIIICDEVQHAAGTPTKVTQFYKVLSSLSARYKIGLTATPKRADGLERAMLALMGDKIYEVDKKEVEHTTCPIEVKQIETGYFPNPENILNGDGTIDYMSLVDDMINNAERRKFIQNTINNLNGSMIVLANRVQYLKDLQAKFTGQSICLSALGQSKKAKVERREALRQLRDGKIDCIFATYLLAKEGLDCPPLRYVVFATPEKDETTVIQSAGRGGRKAEGKEKGIVIDFVDEFGMYKGWAKKRKGFYKKINAKIF